jgi:hypothetical protein
MEVSGQLHAPAALTPEKESPPSPGMIKVNRIILTLFQELDLKEGSEVRAIWSNIPEPLSFKIYIFNLTNPMDVQKGGTPILNEIGPYHYE